MKIKDHGDWVEFNVIIDKYRKKLVNVKLNGADLKDEEGKKVKEAVEVFVKEILVPTRFLKEGITLNGRATNHRYQVQKTKSTIFDKYTQKHYVVKHTVDEIETALNKRNPVGFQLNQRR